MRLNHITGNLDGLPIGKKVRVTMFALRRHLYSQVTDFLKKYPSQITFLKNYSFSGFFFSILIYIFMSIWFNQSIIRFISTVIASIILLIYFEYYFFWIKIGYRDYDKDKK